jgi:hypothetical protein
MRVFGAVAVCSVLLSTAFAKAEDFNVYIRRLSAETPANVTDDAISALRNAGIEAFPALIDHFNDTTPVAQRLDRKDVYRSKPMPVGEVCFDILHFQIEDNWPKGFRQWYALAPQNAQQWLNAHQGQTLKQLRKAAAGESLAKAKAELMGEPNNEFLKKAVNFLQRNYDRLE